MSTLEDALRGYDPVGLHPPALTGDEGDIAYLVEDTGVGRLLLAARSDGPLLASVYVPDQQAEDAVLRRLATTVSPRVLRGGRVLDPARRGLESYLAGRARGVDVPVDLALATPFQREVLPVLASRVGYGERTTYGALAALVGRPTAARAVGAALGANPLCVVLPCHRVVAASGSLTGYAGGLAAKQRLLDLESAAS